ncbi:hypothetical protein YC2023_107740 [Brassica napus]
MALPLRLHGLGCSIYPLQLAPIHQSITLFNIFFIVSFLTLTINTERTNLFSSLFSHNKIPSGSLKIDIENDVASEREISVESDVVGVGEIEMKSGRAIVKPPIEVMVISPDTNQVANLKRI